MKSLAIIGSTGSIGKSALNVYGKNKKQFKLIYLSCKNNFDLLKKQIHKNNPKFFFINNSNYQKKIKNKNKIKNIDFFIKKKIKIDYVISGISGYESIDLNFKLLKISRNLLIANKETIICGGKFFLNYAKNNDCNIIPIDSEHHCIYFFLKNFKFNFDNISKIILMASGGPFLKKKPLHNENVKKVLKHPTWKMGKKISVDSATMANKIMELFEAKILFNVPNKKIDIKIESKSLIHAIIALKNNINFLIGHEASMEIPISNSLGCTNNFKLNFQKQNLNVQNFNSKKFPLIELGFKILEYGHAGMIIFTVINERLVNSFLEKNINYGDISLKLNNIFKKNKIVKLSKKCIKNKSDIYRVINFAKSLKL